MTTLHASSPFDALNRLETMALMAGLDLPLAALRSQIASAIQAIVHIDRVAGGARKVLTVSEVKGLDEAGRYVVSDVYAFQAGPGADPGRIQWTGSPSVLAEVLPVKGLMSKVRLTARLFPGEMSTEATYPSIP